MSNTPNATHDDNSFAFKIDAFNTINPSSQDSKSFKLMVDCEATSHVIKTKEAFIDFDHSFQPTMHFIEMADGHSSNEIIRARGTAKHTIRDKQNQGKTMFLKDALYIPSFPQSLFSVCAVSACGATISFSPERNILVARNTDFPIISKSRLFFLQTNNSEKQSSAFVTKSLDERHKTLGHANREDIIKLQEVTDGMRIADHTKGRKTCITCLETQITKQLHKQDEQQILGTKPLQRVHSDLCGPISPTSKATDLLSTSWMNPQARYTHTHFVTKMMPQQP
ncbi:uncharacterized protein [Watersipora subatra]|uniref:uncharacterized protein n=1 Tax=Watersipora subatra TaxID=2589382 RepID=UPI00355C0EA5